jgi:NADPH:quinone reductase-like Zn-dependent oxidoreductase
MNAILPAVGAPTGTTPVNRAVWLTAKRGVFEIRPAPYTPPGPNQIVVRNHAVAINPVDWMMQTIGDFVCPWLAYPFIGGSDVAGEIVETGAGVTRFKAGDRVLGHAVGAHKTRNTAAEGAFQSYVVLLDYMASPIPDGMAYDTAAVLPLGLSTAACGLFQTDQLALSYPSAHSRPTGKTLLVWGGSTSVGSNAIQLAVAAGYEVIATASPKNFAYVKALGATEVFDYRGSAVIADIIKAFSGRTCAGAFAIGHGSTTGCLDVLHGCTGDKFIAIATPPVSFNDAPVGGSRIAWLVPTMTRMIAVTVVQKTKAALRGIRMKFIFGTSLVDNDVGRMIYDTFLPAALADGRYKAAPDPIVVGTGLEQIPVALEVQKKGVSAKKVVVLL